MADQALGGSLAQGAGAEIACSTIDSVTGDWVNHFQTSNTTGTTSERWAVAKAGDSLTTNTGIVVASYLSAAGRMTIYRSHLLFNIPSNLVRLDSAPQLKLYAHSGLVHPIAITSNAYSNPTSPLSGSGSSINQANLWDNTQTGASALYKATSGTLTNNSYNTIDLDANAMPGVMSGLAAYHCVINAGSVLVISMINAAHDLANSAPTDNNIIAFIKPPGDTNEPLLVLKGAWYKDGNNTIQKYDGDYVINAHNPDHDSFHKRVDQVPFGLSVRGPISLRGTDNAYKITKSK